MTSTIVYERTFFPDTDGKPLDGGKVYVGTVNQDPETYPVACFWDSALTIPATQPLDVTAGCITRNGIRSRVYVAANSYSVRIRNKAGVQVDYSPATFDNLGLLGTGTGASSVGTSAGGTGAVTRTALDKFREIMTPEDFGAVGSGDDTAALQAAVNASALTGKPLLLAFAETYAFTQLTIPGGAVLIGTGATLRVIPGLATDQASLTISDNVQIEALAVSTPGTETNLYAVNVGSNCIIGQITLLADTQRPATGVTVTGSNTRIEKLTARKFDRPIHFDGSASASPTTGNYLGFLDCESFVRAFKATNSDYGTFGGMRASGRSPNGSYTPGHNGILFEDCQFWTVGDCYILGSGEHAVRLSGVTRAPVSFSMGSLTVDSSGGCAFKVNPYSAVRGKNIYVDAILGIDVGDFTESGTGDNKEIVRVCHADKVRIGAVYGDTRLEAKSGQYAVKLNDVTGVTIDSVGGNSLNAGIIFDKDADVDGVTRLNGPVSDVTINNFCGTLASFGSAINVAMDTQSIGDVYINVNGAKGWTTNLMNFSGTPTVTGQIVVSGTVGGSVAPVVNNAPASSPVFMNVAYRGTVYVNALSMTDGITAPSTVAGQAIEYVDTADGDLKVKFGDGVTKTISTDT